MNDTPVRPPFEPPSRSAVFPLPDAILFPNTILPLFVFEPQYRLMLEECLKGDGLMTVVLMRKGAPKSLLDAPTYSTAGIGRVTTVMRLPDSCARVLVGGGRALVRLLGVLLVLALVAFVVAGLVGLLWFGVKQLI
mgnify:CR=1 FL=1